MKRRVCWTSKMAILVSLAATGCFEIHDDSKVLNTSTSGLSSERSQIAASGRYLHASDSDVQGATALDMAASLDISASMIRDAALVGNAIAADALPGLGIIEPRRGDSFVVLSTGEISTSRPEPGKDLDPLGTSGDEVTLRIELNVPRGANRLSFDFTFLSTESPDFIGSIYNDSFTAMVTDTVDSRVIAMASVNSSEFFAASQELAAGTGFDIFTLDPAGVDTEFGVGVPDAGITHFQSINTPISSDGPLTLEFNIKDLGDGILDSAVIIDSVQFSSIELFDPRDAFTDPNGKIITDFSQLAAGDAPRVNGAAADGATRVLLQTKVPGPGEVEFNLGSSAAPVDGGLSSVGNDDRLYSVTIPVQETSPGNFHAFAVYQVPDDFNRGDDEHLRERFLRLHAHFTDDTGDVIANAIDIKLVRPPVLLVHDLWSNSVSWGLNVHNDPRFVISYANYDHTSAGSIGSNQQVVTDAIKEALANMRTTGLAVTQVDVVGAGMGGLLVRTHIDSSTYLQPSNFNAGNINRLITINTPHLGSAVASDAILFRDNLPADKRFLLGLLRNAGMSIEGGAIDDLAAGSTTITAIGHTPVPAHTLIGNGGRNILRILPDNSIPAIDALQNRKMLYLLMEQEHPETVGKSQEVKHNFIFGASSNVFGSDDHDFFVDTISQGGGITGNASTTVTSYYVSEAKKYTESTHFQMASNQAYSERIAQLLDSPVGTPLFAELPAPSEVLAGTSSMGSATSKPSITMTAGLAPRTDGLRITSPMSGTAYPVNSSMSITVAAENGFDPELILLLVKNGIFVLNGEQSSVEIMVPREAVGEFPILALGFDHSGAISLSNTVLVQGTSRASLVSIRILERSPILFGIEATRRISVLGTYSDGFIGQMSMGATYLSSNPEIASVSQDGVITANGPGIATIVANNGKLQDSISVTVKQNSRPVANAGGDLRIECLLPGESIPVTLDASSSFDPDGGALDYLWFENGTQIASGVSPTVVMNGGAHWVELQVSNGYEFSEPNFVRISLIENGEPPLLSVLGANPAIAECGGAYVDAGASASDLCSGDLTNDITMVGTVNTTSPGSYTLTYGVTDHAGLHTTADRTVVVQDTVPPGVVLGTNVVLWPPNHAMQTLQISDCASIDMDACELRLDIDAAGRIVSISSDEPYSARNGDIHALNDIEIISSTAFKIRRERDAHGNGRVYGITFQVADSSGNLSNFYTCHVVVPHHSGTTAFDDGPAYIVNASP